MPLAVAVRSSGSGCRRRWWLGGDDEGAVDPLKLLGRWVVGRLGVGAGEACSGDFVLGEGAWIGACEAVRQRDAEGQGLGACAVEGVHGHES
jgi:hypothetical protein